MTIAAVGRPSVALLFTLLACAAATLSWRAAPSLARGSRGACVPSRSAGAHGTRACIGSARATRAHGNVKRHHRKSVVYSKKKRKTRHVASGTVPAPAPQPAICEGGSTPSRGATGAYECSGGAEPSCANGVEPVSRGDGQPLCPVSPAPGTGAEWSEASCDDGSAPTPTGTGAYSCEDGSAPECEDGFSPTLADEGSMLACPAPSAPPAGGMTSGEGESEGVGADGERSSVRVVISS